MPGRSQRNPISAVLLLSREQLLTRYKTLSTTVVVFGIILCLSTTSYSTENYQEVWRNTTNNSSTATRIVAWLQDTKYDDTSAVPGQHYYYWAKAVTAETIQSGGMVQGLGIWLYMTCPVAATRGNKSPVRVKVELKEEILGSVTGDLESIIWEEDLNLNDKMDQWVESDLWLSSYWSKTWTRDIKISDWEPIGNAEVYAYSGYTVTSDPLRYTIWTKTEVVNVVLRDYFDPAPTNVAATSNDPDKVHITWTTLGGNSSFSSSAEGWRPIDTTPPTPNPMTWATEPYATSSTSIRMVATTASDPSGVEYYFDETSGNSGGSDSGWQDSTEYQDTGLQPNTTYTYRVKARDKSTNHNETGYSVSKSAGTPDTTPPTAEFTGNPDGGYPPLTVYFTDQSTGDISSWSWDFGDADTSSEQSPSHTYKSTGYFTVRLTVSGPWGSDGETKISYVHVSEATTSDLYADGIVNFFDLAILGNYWQRGCTDLGVCEGADIDLSGIVNSNDLRILAEDWLTTPWSNIDIDSHGSTFYDAGTDTWTIIGDGSDIWGQSDGFHYAYRDLQVQGDGYIIARVVDIAGNDLNEWAKAGVMIRETLDSGSVHAMMVMTPTTGHAAAFQWRSTKDGDSYSAHDGTMSLPYWVAISRSGNTFRAYVSPDGGSWTQWGTDQVIPMGTNVYIGLAVTSHQSGNDLGHTCAAKFSNVVINGFPQPSWPWPLWWHSRDISPSLTSLSGSSSYDAATGTWAVTGDGSDIWSNSDGFHYVYKYLEGDGQLTGRVVEIIGNNLNGWAKAGVMIRESTATGSTHAMTVMSPVNGAAFQWRSMTDSYSNNWGYFLPVRPNTWVRLVRNGSTFSGYYSSNGTDWVLQGSATIDMANDIYIGLNVCSHADGMLATGKFDNVLLPQGLFVGARDIGNVGAAGSVRVSSGVYTIKGNGLDIWENSDAFYYNYALLSGNGEIIARVTSIEACDSWTKVGVMMRETLFADSKHAMIAVTPQYRAFQWRSTTGDVSYSADEIYNTIPSLPLPYWVRIERTGDMFRSYVSPDGTLWSLVGKQTILMNKRVCIGLCHTSHSISQLSTARFDNIAVEGNIE